LGVNPSRELSPTQLPADSPEVAWGEEWEGQKGRNPWVKISTVQEGKQKLHMQGNQNKELIQYVPSAGRCLAIFVTRNGYLGRQTP